MGKEKADFSTKKSAPWYSLIVVALGISGMVLACAFDLIRNREMSFGIEQMAGFVVSAIITVSGLRHLSFVRTHLLQGLLLAIYFAGVFFMGLKARGPGHYQATGPLQDTGVIPGDVAMNFLGFVPLGYLMISYLLVSNPVRKTLVQLSLSTTLCIGTSLFIELTQFYLPGRTSSLIDLLVNGSGALCGITYGFMEYRYFFAQSKSTRKPILIPKS